MVTFHVANTAAHHSASGRIYANAITTPPTATTINWTAANQLIATTTTTALTDGKVALTINPSANVFLDVLGYYR